MKTMESTIGGVGTVTRMDGAVIQADPPVLTAEIEITRAETGKVERYTLIGTPVEKKEK